VTAAGRLLDVVADDLDEVFGDGVVYFGGSVVPMYFEPDLLGADELRPTDDVDVLVVFDGTPVQYSAREAALRERGWRPDTSPENRLAYRVLSPDGVAVDMVPSFTLDAADIVLVCAHLAVPVDLPSGRTVQALSPGAMLAARFAAFADRGEGDVLGSADFEDIAMLVACCPAVTADVHRLPQAARLLVARGARRMLEDDVLDYAVGSIPRAAPQADFISRLRDLAGTAW
jgi:hypothetical protein